MHQSIVFVNYISLLLYTFYKLLAFILFYFYLMFKNWRFFGDLLLYKLAKFVNKVD